MSSVMLGFLVGVGAVLCTGCWVTEGAVSVVYDGRDIGVGMEGIEAWDIDRSGTIRVEESGGPAEVANGEAV